MTNVINVVDCCDDSTALSALDKYGIMPERLRMTRSSIFKIPQTAHIEVLTVTGFFAPEDDFLTLVDKHGLKGLRPVLLWSDEVAQSS